ncbi:MAG: peroxiredoxin [Steroidobacteraceae bacterium]
MGKVAVGKPVPALALPSTSGEVWKLAAAADGKLVVYFYPKDMTSGCTLESQGLRDLYPAFRRAKVAVVGVSRDGLASHRKFQEKERLPFELLSDEDEQACKLFDVIREKTLYGRKYLGIERSTFLIHRGILVREWRKVKVPGHAEEVLEAARAL